MFGYKVVADEEQVARQVVGKGSGMSGKVRYMRVVLCDDCSAGLEKVGLQRERDDENTANVTCCDWCRVVFDCDLPGIETPNKYRMYWT